FVSAERPAATSFTLAENGRTATLFVDDADYAGVLRAASSLQGDIQRVTGTRPALEHAAPKGRDVVIIGTLGKSALIDKLVAAGKLDVTSIKGKWEGWQVQTVANPMPGVDRALVIAGADKRGTIYGIYEISEQIGVSPWYWWADVPVKQSKSLYAAAAQAISDAPVVQYRGIFLNDEAPSLTGWVKEKYGGYKHGFYEKVFELILRLRGNYLWPAMWDAAFYDDDPLNGKLADEYGVVMGTSHHEPMTRAQREWARHGGGPWDYNRNEAVLKDYWKKAVDSRKDYEKVVTIGMRGDGDEPMSEESNVALLQKIVADQRAMLSPGVTQMWALYKEVQEYYEKGMRVPDDVLLLWCDDNWGNIRRLPTAEERKRPGGAGVYYHFDYVGGPRSYKWLNVTPLPKIWEQMHLAWQYKADRMWIVNVGDLKPMEVPIEFFLSYAWNPSAWPAERLPEYLKLWAMREFGAQHADEIADLVAKYVKYNGRRKPEQLEPETYSLVTYDESERVVAEYKALAARAEKLYVTLPASQKDAFFQLVLYPVKAGAVVNELYATSGRNKLYAVQGRASTNALAARARELFAQDEALVAQYHALGGGKWNHFMAQTHLGYTYWNQPTVNVMPPVSEVRLLKNADMGVAVEGNEYAWPRWQVNELTVPALDGYERKARFFDVFNRGQKPFAFSVKSDQPWVVLSKTSGTVDAEQRIIVDVRWADVPAGATSATLTISGPDGQRMPVHVPIRHADAAHSASALHGFVETGGVVSMEAEHYARAIAPEGRNWLTIPDHGRTLSAVAAMPVLAPAVTPGGGSMHLEYDVKLEKAGPVTVHTTLAPTLKFQPGTGLRYAVSIDDEAPQIVNVHADESQKFWEKSVSDGAVVFQTKHTITAPGKHVLKFWTVDPGLVLQKLVIDAGGLRPSYLGPQESPRL
ncbi:glycosyl hydrolase 115 family protein, partial [Pseudoduganella sp. RAF53_2]